MIRSLSERDFKGLHCSVGQSTVYFHPKFYSICNDAAKKLLLSFKTDGKSVFFAVQTMTGHFQPNKVHIENLYVISILEVSLRYEVIVIPNPKSGLVENCIFQHTIPSKDLAFQTIKFVHSSQIFLIALLL